MEVERQGFYSRETTPEGLCHYTALKTGTKYSTKSNPSCKLWTLDNNNAHYQHGNRDKRVTGVQMLGTGERVAWPAKEITGKLHLIEIKLLPLQRHC